MSIDKFKGRRQQVQGLLDVAAECPDTTLAEVREEEARVKSKAWRAALSLHGDLVKALGNRLYPGDLKSVAELQRLTINLASKVGVDEDTAALLTEIDKHLALLSWLERSKLALRETGDPAEIVT